MAETEQRVILNISTGESIKNIGELKEYTKTLKKELEGLTIGSEEYKDKLAELNTAQNAMRGAMNDTTATYEEVANAANGTGKSYNALVNRMKTLTQEWRSTEDAAKRANLSKEIDNINTELKELDAERGNFQRNVGDYANKMQEAFSATAGSAARVINPLKNMQMQFQAISATPLIAILGLLAKAIETIIKGLKSSETTMNAVSESFSIFGAASTAVTKTIQALGRGVAKVAGWLGKLLDKMGLVSDSMKEHQAITKEEIQLIKDQREATMRNADDALLSSKLRAKAVEKLKYTEQERINFLKQAADVELRISNRNRQLAKDEYELLQRKAALSDNSREDNDALAESYARVQQAEQAYFDKSKELTGQIVEATNAMNARFKSSTDAAMAGTQAYIDAEVAAMNELEEIPIARINVAEQEIEVEEMKYENLEKMRQEDLQREQEAKERKLQIFMLLANATAQTLGAIAGMYEASGKQDEKTQRKIKALRIAESIINTITGAISAFTSAQSLGFPMGMIVGTAQAAAVTAMGMANIAKIKNTKVGGSTASAPATFSYTNAPTGMVQAPTISAPPVPEMHNLTGAAEEEELKKGRKVYILSSDLEANGEKVRIQNEESSF